MDYDFDPSDIERNRVVAALSYLIFFLPFLACPDSRYARFHANQGLILLLVSIAGSFVLGFVPILGGTLRSLLGIAVLVFGVLGVLNAAQGKAVRLPIIGTADLFR